MSVILLVLLAVLTWAVLAVPLAMLVGKLSRVSEREEHERAGAQTRELVRH